MRVLYLVFNEGYSGDVDLAAEAIRLTRQLAALVDDPEAHGLLALMLLHHARRRSRTGPDGSIVPLADQDRSQWDTGLIAEGIDIAHAALALDRLGEYQAQAAIAALHADAPRVEETDWVQIVEWYDELLRFADTPIVRLNRAAHPPPPGTSDSAAIPRSLPVQQRRDVGVAAEVGLPHPAVGDQRGQDLLVEVGEGGPSLGVGFGVAHPAHGVVEVDEGAVEVEPELRAGPVQAPGLGPERLAGVVGGAREVARHLARIAVGPEGVADPLVVDAAAAGDGQQQHELLGLGGAELDELVADVHRLAAEHVHPQVGAGVPQPGVGRVGAW